MTSRADLFSGSIIQNYERYMVPLLFDDYAQDLAHRTPVPDGGRALEIACGTGVVTRHLAATLGGRAELIATDINPDMVNAAQGNVATSSTTPVTDDARVQFQVADGTDLPFEDDSFDTVTCQFGVMFYPDRELGYREAARVIRPGGAFVFNIWDALERNAVPRVIHETVVALSPDNPPGFLAVPFGYNNLTDVTAELQRSGFGEVELAVLPRTSRASSAKDVAIGTVLGSPLAGQLAERGIADEAFEAVERALVDAFGDGEISVPMQAIAVVARPDPSG